MKVFKLITSDGETINIIKCTHIYQAQVHFSEIKKLTVRNLLSIFSVEIDDKD